MDPLEIARRQLDRLKEARKPYGRRKKVVEIAPEIKVRKRGKIGISWSCEALGTL